jgi:DNA modification methylase
MDGQKADMVFTDPPYNLQERGQTKRTNKTESKRQDFGEWDVAFNPLDVIPNIYLYTAENANIYICTSSYLFGDIHNELEKLDLKPNYVVWCKNNPMPSLSKNRFVQATELIIHAIKGKPTFNYPKGENLPNYFMGNVEAHKFGHPTQKPIYVVEHFINKENGSILDLFLGSGSTMVAAHQLQRKCYGMELDPKYCQVIVDRMHNLDPSLEIKINGKPYDK